MTKLIEKIHRICSPDLYEIGFASLSGLLASEFSHYSYGISLARKLDDSIIDSIYQGPTIEYFNLYHQINNELNHKTQEITILLKNANIEALPIKATVYENELDDDYRNTLCYPLSHKMVATRAGLGWIGKTDLMVTSRFGPRVRLASILMTTGISPPGNPISESQCGECTVCVDRCPAQAATGQLWTTEIDRNKFYDPVKCKKYCRKISLEKIKKDISLCGLCLLVCPQGQ
jgi:epoxyqueuosine reductase